MSMLSKAYNNIYRILFLPSILAIALILINQFLPLRGFYKDIKYPLALTWGSLAILVLFNILVYFYWRKRFSLARMTYLSDVAFVGLAMLIVYELFTNRLDLVVSPIFPSLNSIFYAFWGDAYLLLWKCTLASLALALTGYFFGVVIGIGLGAQILAIAAGGDVEDAALTFETGTATRVDDQALNGYLPETFHQVVYMRDRPILPDNAKTLAVDTAGRPAVFKVGDNAYGFLGHPGIKLGMVEDLIMEFEEVPESTAAELEALRSLQPQIEDELVPIMTGLVQCASLMSSPKAGGRAAQELDNQVV